MAKSESNDAGNADTGASRAAAPKSKSGAKRRAGGANWSPRNCLLVRDFLVPRLDRCLYGEDLKWIDRNEGIFLIRWTHQGSKSFNREGPNVFRDWSILKHKWDDDDPNRLSKAKQRVRAAFRKLPNVRRINEGTAQQRVYCIKDIETYLVPTETKEKKKRKKRRSCGCATGCDKCTPQALRLQAPSSSSGDEDMGGEDMGKPSEANGRGDASSGSDSDFESMPPPTCASDVWSTMRSLTESTCELPTQTLPVRFTTPSPPPFQSPTPSPPSQSATPPPPPSELNEQRRTFHPLIALGSAELEEHDGALIPVIGLCTAELEAVVTLVTLKNASRQRNCHTSVTPPLPPQPAQPTSDLLAPTAQVTVGTSAPPSTARQEDQVVPVQTGVSSPEPSVDEGSLSPHSVHSFKEQVATAMATAPRSTQADTVTGGSPPMFLAEAAPAHQGEQLVSGAAQDSGAMSAFFSQQTPMPEPSTVHTEERPATAAMMGAAAVQSGWSGHEASSSWLARDEPIRTDGCWSSR